MIGFEYMLISFTKPVSIPQIIREDTNFVMHSSLYDFENDRIHNGISLKYSIKGIEQYYIDRNSFAVHPGSFLLVNHQTEIQTYIHSSSPVEGICIYLRPSLVAEVQRISQASERENLSFPFDSYASSSSFHEQIYKGSESKLGMQLSTLAVWLQQGWDIDDFFDDQFYYGMAESLLLHQERIQEEVNRLDCVRPSTRKELYRRLHIGKEYLLDNMHKSLDLDEISREACLSKYHFLRLFRQVFGQTPHQYLIDKRLEMAKKLLLTTNWGLLEICHSIGLKDVSSFGRRFKRTYGHSPAAYRKSFAGNKRLASNESSFMGVSN